MIRALARMLVAGLAFPAAAACLAADWGGIYVHEAGFGRSAGGSAIVVRYEIHLDAGPGGACRVVIDGFQSDETLLCAARAAGATLTLSFKGHGDGAPTNRHGVAEYRPEQSLLALHRLADGGLETTWLGLKLADGSTPPRGRHFVRQPAPGARR